MEERDEARRRFELLKKDMVALKKQLDKEQKEQLQRQAEELEKLKVDIRNKQVQEEERREISALKAQLASLSAKLTESQRVQQQVATAPSLNERAFNPFTAGGLSGPQPGVYLDNYARAQASPVKAVATGGNEMERLLREREDLLRTGAYTTDDPLI